MGDYDEILPLINKWMDALTPYVHDPSTFHTPLVGSQAYGYALNAEVAGKTYTQFVRPDQTQTMFDSTDLRRNATDGTKSQPSPPRYGSRNTIASLDGHVQDEYGLNPTPDQLYAQSRARLKAVNTGVLIYASDWNDQLPLGGQWMDELSPYVKATDNFHSPAVQRQNPANYGFAFNVDIAGRVLATIDSPSTVMSTFDSTILTRNATGPTSTLPSPPRYSGKNTIGFLDGHVP